jgi:probable F420-dependent oxidoreductase
MRRPGLPAVGLWTRQLDAHPGDEAEQAAVQLEAMGYRALWIPEAVHREVLTHATTLLCATSTLVVATGIARVQSRSAQATALAQRFLCERFPGRFLLGLGVSHAPVVENVMGQPFERPVATIRRYLDAMDATRGGSPAGELPRVLAALGPQMLQTAAERATGAHTYLSPPEHTAWARQLLGPQAFLAPAVKAVLDDHEDPATVARASLAAPVQLQSYARNLARFGLDELDGGPSDRVVEALVAIGDVEAVVRRVHEHLDAGADHVCVELLTGDDDTIPIDGWRRLAPALTAVT